MANLSSTTIVHKVRAALRITCDQYAVADTVQWLYMRKKNSAIHNIAKELGMSNDDVEIACAYLVATGLIELRLINYTTTAKWNSCFFDMTWFDNPLPRGTNIPPPDYIPGWWQVYSGLRTGGSKGKTLAYYMEVIKILDPQKLMETTKTYIASVSDPQYLMYPEKFLNPKDRRWEGYLPPDTQVTNIVVPVNHKDMSGMI